jgi:Tfp pilus assembly protein PilN
VRSINLIPAEQRRGAGGLAGRAGGASYVVVGALAVFVLMGVFYALAVGQVSSRQTKLKQLTAQTSNTVVQATALDPYVQFQSLRQQRQAAITSLATSRFDWSDAMDQIARALPSDVTLSSLSGTGGPGAVTTQASPAAPGTTSLAPTGPSVALTGCASSHSEVASVLIDLNRVDGVANVSLSTSAKAAPATGHTGGTSGSTGCKGATFSATLTYAAGAGDVSPITPPHAATATATSTTSGSTR